MEKIFTLKNVLSFLAIIISAFILFTATFLLNAVFFSFLHLFELLFDVENMNDIRWYPALRHGLFAILILGISWPIFKSKLPELVKACYSVVPVGIIFVTMGMFLFDQPWILYSLGFITFSAIIYYLYKTKLSWLYYWAVIYTVGALLIMTLAGVDI